MNIDIERKIGQNIKKLRMDRKMTQDTLAAKLQFEGCDITRSAIAKIEVGQRHVYLDELILLKKIFDVDYEELMKI